MSKKHLDYDDRLEQQYKRLGTRNPACACCGETDPFCLELHHPAGQQHHEDVVIVCRNCHRKLTNEQHDHVPPGSPEPTGQLTTDGHYLLGLADLFAKIAPMLRKLGSRYIGKSSRDEE
jgi:hypothetical protein